MAMCMHVRVWCLCVSGGGLHKLNFPTEEEKRRMASGEALAATAAAARSSSGSKPLSREEMAARKERLKAIAVAKAQAEEAAARDRVVGVTVVRVPANPAPASPSQPRQHTQASTRTQHNTTQRKYTERVWCPCHVGLLPPPPVREIEN
jgi:hypothetical protein